MLWRVVFSNLRNVENEVTETTELIVPALVKSSELLETVVSMGEYLGFYMLTQKEEYKNHYQEGFIRSQEIQGQLANLISGHHADTDAALSHLTENFKLFESKMEVVDRLVADSSINYPAMSYAGKYVNPVGQEVSQLISGMVQSEAEEFPDAERRIFLLTLGSLRYTWSNTLSTFRVYLAMRNQQAQDEITLQRGHVDDLLGRLEQQRDTMNLDQDDSFDQIVELKQSVFEAIDEVIRLHSGKQWRMDAYTLETEIIPLIGKIESDIHELMTGEQNRLNQANSELLTNIDNSMYQIMVMALVALLVGIAVAYFNSQGVATLINGMRDVFKRLEQGDLTGDADLGQSVEAREVEESLDQFSQNMRRVIGQLQNDTVHLNGAAEKLDSVISVSAKATQEQNEQTALVATAMNEMASTVHDIARSAETAATFAHEANADADIGRGVAKNAIVGIDVLAKEVQAAGEVIESLQEECGSIGSVLDVIRGIAEQTNLLALNAAIEAARAGEQGRGFAVVADEVRSLASRTQQSTTEIHDMIERLQAGAADAVSVMNDAREGAKNSSEQVEQAATSLTDIAGEVAKVNDLITQIASATEEQSAVATEILQNVDSIDDLGKQRAARAGSMRDANDGLQKVSKELKQVTAQFTV